MHPHTLPSGPLFGPRFAVVCWLSFVDETTGKNCFQTHSIKQIISTNLRHRSLDSHIRYAAVMQQGTDA